MEDREILDCIHALVAQERRLRDLRDRGEVTEDHVHERLTEIEANLDQMWDLLRQRRARREFGLDPGVVSARDSNTVENYQQ